MTHNSCKKVLKSCIQVIGGGNGPDDSNERQEQNVISAVQDIQKQHSEIKTDTDQYQSSEEN